MARIWSAVIAIACGAIAAPNGAQTMTTTQAVAVVDHLVYAGPDVRVATETIERLLGVKATPGGQHPGRGTRNALIALSASTYIEIIGPDPEQPPPSLPRPFGIDALAGPKLVTWAAKERDLSNRITSAAAKGVSLGALAEGSRQRPDGLLLKWTYTDPRTVVADGLAPFFINWGSTPHPAAGATGGVTLVGLRAEHPNPAAVQQTLDRLGLHLPVKAGRVVALIATIDSPRGRVDLR